MTDQQDAESRIDKLSETLGEMLGIEEVKEPVEEVVPAKTEPEAVPVVEGVVKGEPILEAPDTWTKEAKEGWAGLPTRVKQEVLKREDDIRRGFEAIKGRDELANFGTKFANALAPFSEDLKEAGVNPLQVVESLLKTHFGIAKADLNAKKEIFGRLASDYGITFDKDGQVVQQDPGLNVLRTELDGVKSKLGQIATQRDVERHQDAIRQIELFSQQPENKYFHVVQDTMTQLITSKQAVGLKDAYEKAIWLHPNVREMVIADRLEAEKASASEAKRVQEAKKAMSTQVKTEDSGQAKQPDPEKLDDLLMQELRSIRASR